MKFTTTERLERQVSSDATMPRNLKANVAPSDGYAMEVDWKLKSFFTTAEAAAKAGLELKQKYPNLQIKVFDAKERTRTEVQLVASEHD
jgi:hypothetical protein